LPTKLFRKFEDRCRHRCDAKHFAQKSLMQISMLESACAVTARFEGAHEAQRDSRIVRVVGRPHFPPVHGTSGVTSSF
jgi:hypothetical protein